MILRTFVCMKCGHEVVVNPKLPPDYEPNICTPCYDADEPRRFAAMAKIFRGLAALRAMLGVER